MSTYFKELKETECTEWKWLINCGHVASPSPKSHCIAASEHVCIIKVQSSHKSCLGKKLAGSWTTKTQTQHLILLASWQKNCLSVCALCFMVHTDLYITAYWLENELKARKHKN